MGVPDNPPGVSDAARASTQMNGEGRESGMPPTQPMPGSPESLTVHPAVASSPAPRAPPAPTFVGAPAIESLLTRLIAAKPYLSDSRLLDTAGFPPRAQVVIRGQMDGAGLQAICRRLGELLDACAFAELTAALESVIEDPKAPRFSFDRPGGMLDEGSSWWRAAMAVLGAPAVQPSGSARTMASFVGLGPIVTMWEAARFRRLEEAAASRGSSTSSAPLDPEVADRLGSMCKSLSDAPLYKVSVRLGAEGCSVSGVRDIVKATLQTRVAAGSRVVAESDCTASASELLLLTSRVGYTLDLAAGSARVKTLVGHVKKLERSRPKRPKQPYKFGDVTRGLLGKVDTMLDTLIDGDGEEHLLTIIFHKQTEKEPDAVAYLPRVKALLAEVRDAGALREARRDDGEYTWYKLSEWMQVEIIEAFGASLSHAAWYRFPFLEMVSMYWRVLAREASIVADKHGPKKAYLSAAALYDLVPGVMMAFYFGQLHMLALPLRAAWGSDSMGYSEDQYTGDRDTVEQVVIRTGQKEPDWAGIDPRITDVTRLLPGGQLYTALLPTFKALTQVLEKLSHHPTVEVLQISNQDQVQVRIQLREEEQLKALRRDARGVEVMFDYTFPVDGSGNDPARSVSLCVEVPFLLSTMRFCRNCGIHVCQVYDFWS